MQCVTATPRHHVVYKTNFERADYGEVLSALCVVYDSCLCLSVCLYVCMCMCRVTSGAGVED